MSKNIDEAHRKEMLDQLAKTWEKHPNMRLGQLIENSKRCGMAAHTDIFYVGDCYLLAGFKGFSL